MEEKALLVWCAIAVVVLAAFCLKAWRKVSVMRKGNYTLVFNVDDTVYAVPEFEEEAYDELDN